MFSQREGFVFLRTCYLIESVAVDEWGADRVGPGLQAGVTGHLGTGLGFGALAVELSAADRTTAVEAPSRRCRGVVEGLSRGCRGAVEALPVSSLSSSC